jgi:hypothetical protein
MIIFAKLYIRTNGSASLGSAAVLSSLTIAHMYINAVFGAIFILIISHFY